jgi:EPS-associated MarR family transcriptional regulator
MLTDEYRYKILKRLEANPEISQRELAQELGVSLGRVNYCLKALVEKGMLKVNNFRNSKNKPAYLYLLTPRGIEEKTKVTLRFMKAKVAEYEMLRQEIELLRQDAGMVLDDIERDKA